MVTPRVGVGVIIIRGTKILLGKRKNSHGDGAWSFPGGHLEAGESISECAIRESKEETDLHVSPFMYGPFTNDIFEKEQRHYVTVFVLAYCEEGSPKVMEPEKCVEWIWVEWHKMPTPLFLPVKHLLEMDFSPHTWNGFRII